MDVVDVYILIVSIFFGGYTLVDAVVKDFWTVNPLLAALVLLLVAATLGTTWVLSRMLPITFQRLLQIRSLTAQWLRVDSKTILVLLSVTLLYQLYSYQRFGVFASHDLFIHRLDDLAQEGQTFPYWFTATAFLMTSLTFCVFIAVAMKFLTSQSVTRGSWLVALVSIMLVGSLYGRRNVFYMLFIFLILWGIFRGRNLFTPRSGLLALVVLPVLVMFSNIYMVYRPSEDYYEISNPETTVAGFYSAAIRMDVTVANLQERMAMWQFNYSVLDKQTQHHGLSTPYGDLLWQGFKNSIPSVFWPGKLVYNLDEMAASLYGLPALDYPTNNFAMALADFGLLSVILVPLQLLFVFLSMALLVQATRRHPTLVLLLSGFFLYYLMSVEADYSAIFLLYRNVLIVLFAYFIAHFLMYPLTRVRLYQGKRPASPRPALRMTGWRRS